MLFEVGAFGKELFMSAPKRPVRNLLRQMMNDPDEAVEQMPEFWERDGKEGWAVVQVVFLALMKGPGMANHGEKGKSKDGQGDVTDDTKQ